MAIIGMNFASGHSLAQSVEATLAGGFVGIEVWSMVTPEGTIMLEDGEWPESRWGELADIVAPIQSLTVHFCATWGDGFVRRSKAENEFSSKTSQQP